MEAEKPTQLKTATEKLQTVAGKPNEGSQALDSSLPRYKKKDGGEKKQNKTKHMTQLKNGQVICTHTSPKKKYK